jgi:predicted nucleic acid-binding protein
MPSNVRTVYWDACVFLEYLQGTDAWMPALEAMLDEASSGNSLVIYTSTASITEVAYIEEEKAAGTLDQAVADGIEALWNDRFAIRLVEFNEIIAIDSRSIVRESIAAGRKITPIDAMHLATAKIRSVDEFHTTDKPLIGKCAVLTDLGFVVKEPETMQPRLI